MREYDDDNVVSNERTGERRMQSSWEIIALLVSFMTFMRDISRDGR